MNKPSAMQIQFLKKHRQNVWIVRSARILLLVGFLLLWEITSTVGIIDSFIFSSPSKVALCFWSMVLDKTIFLHIGITLYETLVSFLLVTFISLLCAMLLCLVRELRKFRNHFSWF